MLSCDSGLDQRRYNACQLENTVCVIFLQMVMCLKPRLLTRKPKEPRKSGRPQMCTWRCLWKRWVAPHPVCMHPWPL